MIWPFQKKRSTSQFNYFRKISLVTSKFIQNSKFSSGFASQVWLFFKSFVNTIFSLQAYYTKSINITFHRALYSKHCKDKAVVITQILTPSFQNFFQKSKNKSNNSKKGCFLGICTHLVVFNIFIKNSKNTWKKAKKKKNLLKHFGH
jgi:hypothetical protein